VKYNAIHNERGKFFQGRESLLWSYNRAGISLTCNLLFWLFFVALLFYSTQKQQHVSLVTPPGGKSGIWLFCYVQMFAVEELPLKQVVFINVTIGLRFSFTNMSCAIHVLFVNWVLMEDTSPRFIYWGVINLIKSHFSLIYLLGGYKSDLVIYTTIILPEYITE